MSERSTLDLFASVGAFHAVVGVPQAPRRRPIARRAPSAPPVPADGLTRAVHVRSLLEQYVAAVGTSRPRRSEARKLRERADLLRLERPVRWEEIEQLCAEATERDARAAVHEERAERIAATLIAESTYHTFPHNLHTCKHRLSTA